MNIILMAPTYKRWKTSLPVFITSALQTAKDPDSIKFCFCVNAKDQGTQQFLLSYQWPANVEHETLIENLVQPNLSMYFNMMAERSRFVDEGCILTMLGDDMEFVTPGWDIAIKREIETHKGIGVFWCDDDYIAHEQLPVNLFVTWKFWKATRKPFMCPLFAADMIDVVWYLVGKLTHTLHYLEDTVIRHNHSTRVPAAMYDETFQRLRPLQRSASNKQNGKIASIYASIVAGNLIEEGMGSWT
jgi:hypothetical protein